MKKLQIKYLLNRIICFVVVFFALAKIGHGANKDYPTSFSSISSTQSACSGQGVTLSCTVTSTNVCGSNGTTTVTITWYQVGTQTNSGGTLVQTDAVYTAAASAHTSTYTFSASATNWYYYTVTWTGGSCNSTYTSTTAQMAKVTVSAPSITYATLPYSTDFESTWTTDACSSDALGCPDAHWRNDFFSGTGATTYNYWHREDYTGTDWVSSPGSSYVTSTAESGSHFAVYDNVDAKNTSSGALDIYVDLSSSTCNPTLSFWYVDQVAAGNATLTVLLSTNGGATFPTTLLTLPSLGTTPWNSETVTIPSTGSTCVIRFLATGNNGAKDFGIDNLTILRVIAPLVTNFSTPSATTFCAGSSSTVTVNSTTLATGTYTVTYNLSAPNAITGATATMNFTAGSPGSGTFTTVALATAGATTYTITSVANACGSVAPAGGNTGTISLYTPTYATLPYAMDFENTWITNGCTGDLLACPDAAWRNDGTATNSKNYWHREDYGPAPDWTTATTGRYGGTVSESGSHSAVYDNHDAISGSTGALDLYVNLSSSPCNPALSFWYMNQTAAGATSVTVLLSTDGGNTFSNTLLTLPSTGNATWANTTLTIPSTGSTCVIRFLATGNAGAADFGIDNLTITAVSAPIVTNFSIPSATTFCAGGTSTVTVNSSTLTAGTYTVTYNLSAPNAVTGATAPMIFASGTGTFTTGTLATNGNTTITITSVSNGCTASPGSGNTYIITGPPSTTYATLPYAQDFENTWGTDPISCDALGIPDVHWRNDVISGGGDANDYWHRNDYAGTDWAYGEGPAISAESGTYSAVFSDYSAAAGTTGALDLYVDLSSANCGATLSFWYLSNVDLGGTLTVQLSTNGGSTFNNILGPLGTITTWTQETYSIPSNSTSATSVIRFLGTSEFDNYSTGIDNLTITSNGPSPTWTGNVNNDWNNTGNWCNGAIPSNASNVIIPVATNYPTINGGPGAVCASLTINSGASMAVPAGNTLAVSGNINNAGTLSNAGAISLTGNWANSGTFTSSSTVQLNGSSAQTIANSGTNTFSTLDINNASGVTDASAITLTNLTIGDVTANSVFSDGGFQITGSGTFTLNSGSTLNIGGGTANLTTFPAFATTNMTSSSTATVLFSSTGANQSIASTPSAYPNLTFTGGTKTASGIITANNLFTQTAGQFNIAAHNVTVGSLTGTGAIGSASGTPVLQVGSDNTSPAAYSGNILVDVTLTKVGTGALTLSGAASTYTLGTNLNGGQLNINSTKAIGAAASRLTITGGTTIDNTSGGAITLANNNLQTWNGSFTFTGSNALTMGTGAVTLGGSYTVTTTANVLTEGGIISGSTFTITKAGAGTLTLSGANTYTGGTTLSAGQLNINNLTAIGTGALSIANGTTIDNTSAAAIGPLTNNNLQTWNGNFAFVGTKSLNMGTGTITLTASPTITVNGTTTNILTEGGTINNNAQSITTASSGTGELAFGSQSITLNSFTIGSGTTLLSTSGNMSLAGNFGNSGTFTANGGTVTFNGGSPQTITGVITFHKLAISNTSGGVSLSASSPATLDATGILTLNSGVFTTSGTGNYVSVTNTATGAVTAGSAFSATNCIDGPLKWALAASTNYTYPLGDGGVYYPFGVNLSATVSTPVLTVNAVNGNVGASTFNSPIVGGLSTTEYWFSTLTGTCTVNSITLTRTLPIDVGSVVSYSPAAAGAYSMVGATVGTVTSPSVTSTSQAFSAGSAYFIISGTTSNGRFGLWFDFY